MLMLAHCRSFLARHRRLYWCVVATITAIVALLAAQHQQRVESARRSWADPVDVWVAGRELAPGDDTQLERRSLPRAAIPDGALVADPGPVAVLRHLHRHEVATVDDVGTATSRLAESGSRIVRVRTDELGAMVEVGDRVDVVADGRMVATDGVVIAVTPGAVAVAVAAEQAAPAASAAHDGGAELVVRVP